jgi:thiosulfate/3-mercaptopyruvate sulfurtransferase
VSDLPRVVDAAWLAAHLGEDDLVVGDVRGPNAHMRAHIPGSRPLVLGSPSPSADAATAHELAKEVALRLRRHGVTGEERLVLVDRGDAVGAMPAAQMAELAGHPRVAVLLGGLAGWPGELSAGAVELEPVREASLVPNVHALPTRDELASRLDDPTLLLLDVRHPDEFAGKGGYPCDPRQGHIPGAKLIEVGELFAGPGLPEAPGRIRELVGLPEGAEVVAYCHSGSRSALATLALRYAGYDARNYAGSWHEWSRHDELPLER